MFKDEHSKRDEHRCANDMFFNESESRHGEQSGE